MLAVLNSAMNPVIYTLASKEMRRAFFRLVCGCLVKGKGTQASPMQPALDPSRSKSSSSNNSSHSPKVKEDLPRVATSSCIIDKNRSFQNGVLCK